MKITVIAIILLPLCGCNSQRGLEKSHLPAGLQNYTSANPVCDVDIERSRVSADQGDLASARKLRDYYWDCADEDNQRPLEQWGQVAAKSGDKTDEKEYLRILQERRFEGSGREWESPPTCKPVGPVGTKNLALGKNLPEIHRRISYYIRCENAGISYNILNLARRAAEIGNTEDVIFYRDITDIKRDKIPIQLRSTGIPVAAH